MDQESPKLKMSDLEEHMVTEFLDQCWAKFNTQTSWLSTSALESEIPRF